SRCCQSFRLRQSCPASADTPPVGQAKKQGCASARPRAKKKGRTIVRPEFREETPRRRTAEPLTNDPYRTAQFSQRSPEVNPPPRESMAGFGFPHSSGGIPRLGEPVCAAQGANRSDRP